MTPEPKREKLQIRMISTVLLYILTVGCNRVNESEAFNKAYADSINAAIDAAAKDKAEKDIESERIADLRKVFPIDTLHPDEPYLLNNFYDEFTDSVYRRTNYVWLDKSHNVLVLAENMNGNRMLCFKTPGELQFILMDGFRPERRISNLLFFDGERERLNCNSGLRLTEEELKHFRISPVKKVRISRKYDNVDFVPIIHIL